MSKIKKVLAMLLALAMVLGTTLTAFADAPNHKPTEADVANAKVTNITTEGVTVTAYKIVRADYNNEGFTGYKWVDGIGKDVNKSVFGADGKLALNDTEITELASTVKEKFPNGGINMSASVTEDGAYEATLKAGTYMVLVTNSGTTVYNPMLVSVGYSIKGTGDNNTLVDGAVSAKDNWTLITNNAYAKSSEPGVEKTIETPGSGNNHGDDVAIGSEVSFKIVTKLPSYSKQYENPKFIVTDTLSKGLTYKEGTIAIKNGKEETIDPKKYTIAPITVNPDTKETVISIDFNSDFVAVNQNLDIIITYTATLNEEAGINFDANTNSVKVEYSNDPTDDSKLTEKKDKTYHYTFGIDANLNGSDSKKTQELYKVNENGNVVVDGETVTVTNPLKDAKFELRKEGKVVGQATSGEDGSLTFTGLDAGTYELVEIEAPAGYSLDKTPHTVLITAEYYTEGELKGKLKTYSIKIDGDATSTYKATYEGETTTVLVDKTGSTAIKNTKIGELPSTGGIGTTIFTIGGCLIMIVAAGLFFASRRKSAK